MLAVRVRRVGVGTDGGVGGVCGGNGGRKQASKKGNVPAVEELAPCTAAAMVGSDSGAEGFELKSMLRGRSVEGSASEQASSAKRRGATPLAASEVVWSGSAAVRAAMTRGVVACAGASRLESASASLRADGCVDGGKKRARGIGSSGVPGRTKARGSTAQ